MENPNRISMTGRIAVDPCGSLYDKEPVITDDQIDQFIDTEDGIEYIMDLMLDQTVFQVLIQSIALGDNEPVEEIRKWARDLAKARLEAE